MKVQISLNDSLLARIDKCAKENYLSRSAFLSLASTQYLNGLETAAAMRDLSVCLRKISDTGVVDDETEKKLSDIERVVSMFSSSAAK